jgi:hypothetical protein
MNVTVAQKLIDSFRRRAKRVFPLEKFAFIAGRRNTPEEIQIVQFIYPEQTATLDEVTVSREAFTKSMESAAKQKLILLGSIHSHPFPYNVFRGIGVDPVMSIGDVMTWGETDIVNGVMTLTELANGTKASDFCFWGKPSICGVKLT